MQFDCKQVLLELMLEHIGTHSLHIIYGCFPSTLTLLTSCDRDCMVCQAGDIHHLSLYRNILLTPVLQYQGTRILLFCCSAILSVCYCLMAWDGYLSSSHCVCIPASAKENKEEFASSLEENFWESLSSTLVEGSLLTIPSYTTLFIPRGYEPAKKSGILY